MKRFVPVVLASVLLSACGVDDTSHVTPQNDSTDNNIQLTTSLAEDPAAKTDIISGQYIGYSTTSSETTSLSSSDRHVLISHGFKTQQ